MKNLLLPTLLLLTFGLTACSKNAENSEAQENTQSASASEMAQDISANDEDAQPLDAAPVEDDSLASSEAVAAE